MSSSKNAAQKIWDDLTGRSGMDFDLDDEIVQEIIETWQAIIDKEWGEK